MIRVPVQTFNRLANACGDDPERPFCHGVMIETTLSGKVFAVASDGKVLACERIGFVQNCPPSETIIPPIGTTLKDAELVIMPVVKGLPIAPTAWLEKDGMPVQFLAPIMVPYIDWRSSALPKPAPKKPTVPVSFSARHISKLLAASPSGGLVFPEFIDVGSSVVVNDPDVPEWFGLFMPVRESETKRDLQPAIIPGWFE